MRLSRLHSALVLALLVLALAKPAAGAEVSFTLEVPGGTLKSLRLRNLPEGAVVSVDVQASGEMAVLFVRSKDPKEPSTRVRPLFAGRLERRLAFSVTIPSAGHYYVVFDNRKWEEARNVTVRVRAARGPSRETPEKTPLRF